MVFLINLLFCYQSMYSASLFICRREPLKYFYVVQSFFLSYRYYYLAFRAHQLPETSRENVIAILERAKLQGVVLGKTKVA